MASRFYVIKHASGLSLNEWLVQHPELAQDFEGLLSKQIRPLEAPATKRMKNSLRYEAFVKAFSLRPQYYSIGFREIASLKRHYTNEDLLLLSSHYFNLYVYDVAVQDLVTFTDSCVARKHHIDLLWGQNLPSLIY